MNTLKSLYSKFYNPFVIRAGRIAFYLGLLFEIVIFTLDRADYINPYQSYMFRFTFLLFVIKCICTKYDKKQFLFIICTAIFSFITYRISGKDEVVRAMVFIISMKDLDLKRTLRFNFFLTSFSVAILGLLSVFGILGTVIAPFGYAEKSDAFMVCFGLGSSNTWALQIYVLILLLMYLYHDRWNKWAYLCIALGGFIVYFLSKTKTCLIMMLFTALFGYLLSNDSKIKKSKFIYIFANLIVVFSVAFSVFAAKITCWYDFQPAWQTKLDNALTGRITSLYAYENGGAVLSNWKLFGADIFKESFDMGIVRMFWWYGIIPGALAILAILYVLYYLYKKDDYMGILLIASVMIFSIIEAHFISVFISRAYILFFFGAIWYKAISSKDSEPSHIAFYIGSLSKGGAERVFVNLAEYFANKGYKVTIITQYKKENEYELPQNCERIISDITEEEQKGRIYNFFARYFKLHNIFTAVNADVLLTTIGKNNFMAIVAAIFIPTKVVVSIVADPKEEYNNKLMRILMQVLFPEADGIVMQTTQSLKFMKLGLDKKCIILPNSVSADFVVDRYEGERDKNIYTVGRMDANKNHKMAIDAFSNICNKYPDSKLILIGDGELREELESYTEKLGISDRVQFTGIVSDVYDRLYKAYLFILTSNSEGMPNTLLEAMSLGVACISTDCPCGGPYDLISPDKDGILVPVGDTKALTVQMDRLLGDTSFAYELGQNAHETMKAYVPDAVNAKWNSFFTKVYTS